MIGLLIAKKEMRIIDHKLCRKLMWGMLLLGMLFCAIPAVIFPSIYLYFINAGAIIMGLSIILAILYLRCPYCRGALNIRGLPPDYCPHCGKKIS